MITTKFCSFSWFFYLLLPQTFPGLAFYFLQWFENIIPQVKNQNILELDGLTSLGWKETRLSELVMILKKINEVSILKPIVH